MTQKILNDCSLYLGSKAGQDFTCPPSFFLESLRTWKILMHLVMVSDGRDHSREASMKVSRSFDIRNPVKTPPVLQVSSWRLRGHGGSWRTWWWSQMKENILEKLPWKFHEDWTTETLSRLHLSSKSLPGVLEDMEDPDVPGDGLRWKRTSKRSFPESFMKFGHQKPCQDSPCPPSLFLES